jgi:hypothetical protein
MAQDGLLYRSRAVRHEDHQRRRREERHRVTLDLQDNNTEIDTDRESADGVEENQSADADFVKEWTVWALEVAAAHDEFEGIEADVEP